MSHKAQLEDKKYRNWVRAGLGIKYVKEGLEPFCDHLVNQQHIAILDEVKRKHNLTIVSCGLCDVRTLQPDHVQTKTRQCPLGQTHCNCLHSGRKTACPNNVCGAIYDEIIKRHASTPPTPFWRNTDAHQWCTEPWAVAKCFVNAPGYEQKKSVFEFDCSGLLHLLINNIEFHKHIQCVISGQDVFSRVLRHRNAIFHSNSMELDDSDITTCVDDMIELLQDDKEIKYKQESKEVVKKLLELKQDKFIITTTDETEIRRIAMSAIDEKEKSLQQKIVDGKTEIGIITDQSEQQVKWTGSTLKDQLAQTGLEIKEALKKAEIDSKERLEQKETEIKHNLRKTEVDSKQRLDQKETEIKDNLKTTEVVSKDRLEQKQAEIKHYLRMTEGETKQRLDQKETEIKDNLRMTEVDSKDSLEQKEAEIKDNLRMTEVESKQRLDEKETEINDNLRMTEVDSKDRLEQKEAEIKHNLSVTEVESKQRLDQKATEIKDNLRMTELDSKDRLEQKEIEIKDNLRITEVDSKEMLNQKETEIKDNLRMTEANSTDRLEQKEAGIKHNLRMAEVELIDGLEQKETEIKENLRMTEQGSKKRLEQKETEIKHNLRMTETDSKDRLEQKKAEINHNLSLTEQYSKKKLEQKEIEIKKNLRMAENNSKERLEQKEIEMKEKFRMIEVNSKLELKQEESEIIDNLRMREERIDQKGKEMEEDLERKMKHILDQRDRKQKEHRCSEDISKEAADDLKKVGSRDMPLPNDYERKSADFQMKLIKRYKRYARQVSSIPLKPHRKKMNVSDVYVHPWMTVEKYNEQYKEWKDIKVSINKIFRIEEVRASYIYVIGDAGTGKSMFCKMLLHFWCVAHSHQEITSLEEPNIVNEMKRFKFLFYISLRHFAEFDSIEQMIENSYHDPVLRDILQNESGKCLMVLDGLDEWKQDNTCNSQFLTPGLPGRELDADYTIITTTRPWKFDALQINENEVDTKVNLKGIDTLQMRLFTEKTVKILNDNFQQSKCAVKCENDLDNRHVSDISHIPLILQQLICLWFDGKLQENAKHAIYSNMLSLFFEWNALKRISDTHECEIVTQARINDLPLPDYLCDFKALRGNIRVVQYLSQLAYETLFDKNKATTLTFSSAALERLNIPSDIVKYCLEIGILTEEVNESMPASTSQQSLFSFFHKSLQEYLAAVYVASQLKEMLNSLKLFKKENADLTGVYKTCVRKFFSRCKTVVDILDKSNVLIMLCGLEPRLLTNVSKYIYDVTLVDEIIVAERFALQEQILSNRPKLIANVQMCIFMCIEEVLSRDKAVHTPVYIADIYINSSKNLQRYVENVILKNVLSVDMVLYVGTLSFKDTYLTLELLTNCDQLKAIQCNSTDKIFEDIVIKILNRNVNTLESVSLLQINKRLTTHLLSVLPNMRRLTILQMSNHFSVIDSLNEYVPSFTFMCQSSVFKHIAFEIPGMKDGDIHKIDLSKHEQLKYIDLMTNCMVSCNTDNIETFKLSITSNDTMKQVCNTLYKADKLKHLCLYHGMFIRYWKTEYISVTENLTRLLPSLGSLSTLKLIFFTLTANIIACPRDMKNLREIILHGIRMSMTTWCKFINSLPELPQVVTVQTDYMVITDELFGSSSGEMFEDSLSDARQYVRENASLFRVTCDYSSSFQFTTTKRG